MKKQGHGVKKMGHGVKKKWLKGNPLGGGNGWWLLVVVVVVVGVRSRSSFLKRAERTCWFGSRQRESHAVRCFRSVFDWNYSKKNTNCC